MFHHGWDAGSGWLMLLWMVIFWGFIITLSIVLLRWLLSATRPTQQTESGQPSMHKNTETAFDVAQKRYARGEISRTEFQQIVQDLQEIDGQS